MKISEVELGTIKDHCGISGSDSDGLLEIYKAAAAQQISGYTGLTAEEMDELPDLTYAYLALVCEMFNSRTVTVEIDKVNPMAMQIMNSHCVNLL